jgi:hypothetical protein
MIREHDRVVLTAPVPKERLEIGDVGAVVHVYPTATCEVDVAALDGHTAAIATVDASHVRPIRRREITYARELATH